MTPNRISDKPDSKVTLRGVIFTSVISIFFIIMIGATLLMEERIKESVNQAVNEDAIQSIETSKSLLISSISQYQKDVKFLEKSSALIEFSKTLADTNSSTFSVNNDTPQSKAVKQTFLSIMQQQPEIEQLRIIAYPTGFELIRMERENNNIIDVAENLLQNKGSRDYFLDAAAVIKDEVYISDIDLNRENGEIQYPITPTIRLAIPLSLKSSNTNATTGDAINSGTINGDTSTDDAMTTVAILVANVNAQYLLDALVESVDPRFSAYLLNESQNFLVNPIPNTAFTHEFNAGFSWATVFGELNEAENELAQASINPSQDPTFFYIKQSVVLSSPTDKANAGKELVVTLIVGMPESLLNAMRNESRVNAFGLAGVFTVLVLIALLFFNAYIKRNVMLNRAKLEYQAIVDASADAIIGVSLEGLITTWNKASEELFSIKAAHAISEQFDELVALTDINILAQIEQFKANPRITNQRCESKFTKLCGELILDLSVSAITTHAEGVVGVSIICKDVTLQKHAQTQVQNTNQSLEYKVNARTRELKLAKDEAEHANVVKSAFISNISHEMRTPLNGILGTLELVTKEPLSDTQKSYLQMTETSINSLTLLINDILDLSKIEAGKMSIDTVPFDLINEFEKTMIPVAIKAYSKNLTFIFDTSGVKFRHLLGDKNRINQITNNILSNAVKFTDKGEVSVQLQSYQSKTGIVILCAISDTGIGIDSQYYNRIFGTFNQEDISISSKFGGTGLGLSICKQLSKLMDGDVTFTSQKGKGSTFYYSLLVAQDNKQSDHHHLLRDVHISLVCEHTKESRSIKASLENYGAVVIEVSDATRINDSSNILLIDGEYAHKQSFIDAFSKIRKPYAKVIELFTPNVFAERSHKNPVGKTWELMKPFTTSSLLELLGNSEGYNTLARASSVLANKPQSSFLQMPSAILVNRVLIVDDNDINTEVIKGMIGPHAQTMFCASNGKDALTMLKRTANSKALFDLVLLDCNMPIMDGFECVKRIRRGEAGEVYKDIPVVAVTADAMLGDQQRCLDAGMNDYLTKPIQSRLLIDALAKWSSSQMTS